MATILTLLRKDFSLFRRDRVAVALTFLVPMLMIFVFGQVFGLNRKDYGPVGIPLAVVNECSNPGAQRLLDALRAEKGFKIITTTKSGAADGAERALTTADLRPLMRENAFRFALVIPADLVGSKKLALHLQMLSNPRNEIETQTVNGLLQKCIFSNVPQLLGQSLQERMKATRGSDQTNAFNRSIAQSVSKTFGADESTVLKDIEAGNFGFGAAADEEGMRDLTAATPANKSAASDASKQKSFIEGLINIENEQVVGRDVKSPAAARNIGGWAIMFLLFTLSHSAISLFDEKRAGLFQRLLSSSVTPTQVLWSKFLFGILLGLVQLLALFFAGRIMFGLDVTSHFVPLLIVCVAAAGACTSFGMLIASIAKTPAAASSMTTLLVLLMSCLGGAWVPVSIMPQFIQKISVFTIPYWAIEGFMQVFWAGDSLARLLPTVSVLLAITIVAMAIAWWRFKRGTIFEP